MCVCLLKSHRLRQCPREMGGALIDVEVNGRPVPVTGVMPNRYGKRCQTYLYIVGGCKEWERANRAFQARKLIMKGIEDTEVEGASKGGFGSFSSEQRLSRRISRRLCADRLCSAFESLPPVDS